MLLENTPPETLLTLVIGVTALFLFTTISFQIIFSKLYEAGWKAWVPFVNMWTFFAVAGMSGAWMFATIVPLLGIVVIYMAVHRISTNLGFGGTGMVFLAIFFPLLWLFVMAGSKNKSDSELAAIEQKNESRYAHSQPQPTVADMGRSWALAGVPVSHQSYPPPAPNASQQNPPEAPISFGYKQQPAPAQQQQPVYADPFRPVQPNPFQPPSAG